MLGGSLSWVRFAGLLLAACASASTGGDAVVALDRKLASGEVQLRFAPKWGYLPALLDELDIPRSSQLLVFSKTSAQFRWITPQNPRAIYFNDETYVGWVPGASLLEISTATPDGGAAFYTLSQQPAMPPRLAALAAKPERVTELPVDAALLTRFIRDRVHAPQRERVA